MNKKITLLFTLLAFALSSSAQISFNINEYEDLNLDYDRFDFDKKYVVTNNAENADDTTFIWKVSSVERQEGLKIEKCVYFYAIIQEINEKNTPGPNTNN